MEIGLVILRAVVGLLLAAHGAQKLFGVARATRPPGPWSSAARRAE
jgi:hypothetical protein